MPLTEIDDRFQALAIRVDGRWYCGRGAAGQFLTGWTLTSAKLFSGGDGLEEAKNIAYQIGKRGRVASVETVSVVA